ncbi:hypothetical protein ABZ471_20560 [Streptomyces sp. NPDC005728]|uniref:hypothetical protein n=1 Tax=Streptomyces sp. NPDC005728 TaxID=3157054 RepID=UPI0033F470D1
MARPVVGLWLFHDGHGVQDAAAGLQPWLETFCDPVLPVGDGHADSWIADARTLGLKQADADGTGCHVGDAEFLAARLRHPGFHWVK